MIWGQEKVLSQTAITVISIAVFALATWVSTKGAAGSGRSQHRATLMMAMALAFVVLTAAALAGGLEPATPVTLSAMKPDTASFASMWAFFGTLAWIIQGVGGAGNPSASTSTISKGGPILHQDHHLRGPHDRHATPSPPSS